MRTTTRASLLGLTAVTWLWLVPGPISTAKASEAPPKLLLQKPTVSQEQVAFSYAGDLWIVPRSGGEPRRLTSGMGQETEPVFSPDGTQIAFTGEYEGNLDVYVVPSSGGVPRRMTYHPGPEHAVGWTRDGKRILFRSLRQSYARFSRLFTIGLDGDFPQELPLPMAVEGSYSPDGKHLAYVPFSNFDAPSPVSSVAWKRYRGGTASPIWVADLADSSVKPIPRKDSNDSRPMWVGDKIYFLSDRDGPITLYSYDPASEKVERVVENKGLDIKSASAGPDAIVYEQFGSLHLFDPKSGKSTPFEVQVRGDLTAIRPRYEKVAKGIQAAAISPTGARAVFEARGEILTVPAEKGDIRNLTNSTGAAERDPSWSPDGKWIACLSDESGEYKLQLRPQSGKGDVKSIALGDSPSYYYGPNWSPDSKKIAYTDNRINLWYVDIDSGVSKKVDTGPFMERLESPAWSPDSRWLTYSRQLKNHLRAVFVYSLETGKTHRITDGMSDADYPVFDKGGKYLYFLASTDIGPAHGQGGEMSTINHPVTRSPYLIVLDSETASPLAPESDEEKDKDDAKHKKDGDKDKDKKDVDKEKDKEKKDEPQQVRIDFEDIDQRILALPMPARDYSSVLAGKEKTFYVFETPPSGGEQEGGGPVPPSRDILHKFDLEKRKSEKALEGIGGALVSHDGEKLLYRQGANWFIVAASQLPKPAEKPLKTDEMEVRVEPLREWAQMYHEVWRIERDFLYDPGFHGLDLKAAEDRYRPYLNSVAHRHDLNYLFTEMLGELSLGHVYISGGDLPEIKGTRGGLLGADFRVENGRYRIAKIYRGESWNPKLRAPLTQPGNRVKEGEYLLAVDGRDLTLGEDGVYAAFEGKAGRSVTLKVGPDPQGKDSREVSVVPIENDRELRGLAWVDENRRKVDKLSNGKVAYIYMPNTALEGYRRFNREFFAQTDKEAAVLDERFNGGGMLAEYVIDRLRRPLLNFIATRVGEDITTPLGAIHGPKAMIINQMAGSGGDYMPYAFRQAGVGKLVGKRTWGGLVGIGGYPTLIDGGRVTAPHIAIWFPTGDWEVENRGVAPDIDIEQDPKAVREGHDPQLEKAVEVVLEELKKSTPLKRNRPAYPNYHKAAAPKAD
ncbi:S41 family peptidase [Singulisphaera sp. PoT]|uniref:S41 family peptidase n=1 Tax=Singulisphaera sp. PoT TaxID=3411797 RepID=UPI003BF4832E